MILPKELAAIFIEDIDLAYIKNSALTQKHYSYSPTPQNYLDFAGKHIHEQFMIKWSNGGTVGSCWDESDDDLEHVGGDIEPNPTALINFLNKYFSQLNLEEISAIKNLYNITYENESDYYGGSIEYAIKNLSFKEFQEKLVDFLYKDELECVNFYDLLIENSEIITTLNIITEDEYFKYKLYKKMDSNINIEKSGKSHKQLKI